MGSKRDRNKQPNIADSIARDIAVTIGNKDIHRAFEDGKPHEIMFLDAILLDGRSIETEVHRPMVMSREVRSYEEFSAAFTEFTDLLTKAYRDAVREDFTAVLACAKAGLVFALESMKGEDRDMDAIRASTTVLGTALTAKGLTEFERAMGMPPAVFSIFKDYLQGDWPCEADLEAVRSRYETIRPETGGETK